MTIIITPNYPETKTDFKQHIIVNKVRKFRLILKMKSQICSGILETLECPVHYLFRSGIEIESGY